MELRFLQVKEASGEMVQSPEVVADIMVEESMIDRECFWVIHLNAANKIIEKELVSVGSVNSTIMHPREVFKKAILNGAIGIITVHNHPSGQAQPSREDKIMWHRLDGVGKLLSIEVLDHIILSPSGECYSKKQGNIFHKKGEETK